jgi:hypothetical protein
MKLSIKPGQNHYPKSGRFPFTPKAAVFRASFGLPITSEKVASGCSTAASVYRAAGQLTGWRPTGHDSIQVVRLS